MVCMFHVVACVQKVKAVTVKVTALLQMLIIQICCWLTQLLL